MLNACGDLTLNSMENHIARKGCASNLKLLCENCGWKQEFCSSKKQGKSFEVNRRLVYSMRSLGKGQSGAKKFCTLMNMPPHLKQLPKKLKALQKKVCLKLPLKLEIKTVIVVMR